MEKTKKDLRNKQSGPTYCTFSKGYGKLSGIGGKLPSSL